jgi:two-component system OmpR family response regulator
MPAVHEESILVVEDDPTFVADLLALWRPAGPVRWAGSAEEAVRLLHEALPQLVLLDLCLPSREEEGLGLLSAIRTAWGTELPVVIVSRADSPQAKSRALGLGATAFLTKPVDLAELERVVAEVLRGVRSKLN